MLIRILKFGLILKGFQRLAFITAPLLFEAMNPLNSHVYQVEDRVYRRNVPLELCTMGGLASQARFCAETEEVIECGVNMGKYSSKS